ncbi:MAG: hypothetical protein QM703_01085 [Gemmatales bacterium]
MPKSIASQSFLGILLGLLAVAGCSSPSNQTTVSNTPPSPWGSLPWGSLDFVQYYVALELIFERQNPYDQGTRRHQADGSWPRLGNADVRPALGTSARDSCLKSTISDRELCQHRDQCPHTSFLRGLLVTVAFSRQA